MATTPIPDGNPPSQKAKPIRLNVVLSKADKARIDRLVEMMEAETVTDVTKQAFLLLEFFLKQSEKGAEFFVQNESGDKTKLEILGVTT